MLAEEKPSLGKYLASSHRDFHAFHAELLSCGKERYIFQVGKALRNQDWEGVEAFWSPAKELKLSKDDPQPYFRSLENQSP